MNSATTISFLSLRAPSQCVILRERSDRRISLRTDSGVAISAGQLLRGVHPESYEILPRHFVQGLGSHAQNDRKRRAQDDIGGKIAELVPSVSEESRSEFASATSRNRSRSSQ
ncbi:MAG: hypothetical protein OEW82_05335 [Dehalococcoidia bacterium]|nr:hypothetical protein [Dehalococcoidia bacterium]